MKLGDRIELTIGNQLIRGYFLEFIEKSDNLFAYVTKFGHNAQTSWNNVVKINGRDV